jgi:predicted  nucleic acid-binding Zn-ribbon protein
LQEENKVRVELLEGQKLSLQQELSELERRLNQIRVQITQQKSAGVGSLDWLMSER